MAATELFNTEIKRDQNMHDGGQRGHDMFVRNGGGSAGASAPIAWGGSGTVYAWSLAYDGDHAALTVGSTTRSIDVTPDGDLDAIRIIARAIDTTRFTHATVAVTITSVNGAQAAGLTTFTANFSELASWTIRTSDFAEFHSIGGTLAFTFETNSGATGSPNSQFAFVMKGLDATLAAGDTPASGPGSNAVVAPPALVLFGLGAIAVLVRRRR